MKITSKAARRRSRQSGTDKVQDVFWPPGKLPLSVRAPDGFHANRVIDADGLVVCPGLVDLSARLREPGFEYKATLESEMAAAVAGGVTSLACPPDTDPPLDEPGLVEMLKHRARSLNQAHVYPLGALTQGLKGERITEMAELVDAGCVAFSQADVPLDDNQVLLRAMQYATTFGYPVWLRPQRRQSGPRRRRPRRTGGYAPWAGADSGCRGNGGAVHHAAACPRNRRTGAPVPAVERARAWRWCARPRRLAST